MSDFGVIITSMTWNDYLDILLVGLMFYVLLNLLRRTRSPLALRGMIGMLLGSFAIYFLSSLGNLSALTFIFERFWIVIVLVFVVIFQNDFKSALTEMGQLRAFRAFFSSEIQSVDEIVSAVALLSKRKTGALIAMERRNNLKVYADTGTPMDCVCTEEVLRTIFTPQTPLHDGAVIVRNERIVAAGAILPLTDSPALSRDLGTRHRAAIGLSEETDAIIIVVSEETAMISISVKGQLERGLPPDELRKSLKKLLTTEDLE